MLTKREYQKYYNLGVRKAQERIKSEPFVVFASGAHKPELDDVEPGSVQILDSMREAHALAEEQESYYPDAFIHVMPLAIAPEGIEDMARKGRRSKSVKELIHGKNKRELTLTLENGKDFIPALQQIVDDRQYQTLIFPNGDKQMVDATSANLWLQLLFHEKASDKVRDYAAELADTRGDKVIMWLQQVLKKASR